MADDDVMKAWGANTHTVSQYEPGASGYTRGSDEHISQARAAAIKEYQDVQNMRLICLDVALKAAEGMASLDATAITDMAETFFRYMKRADGNG